MRCGRDIIRGPCRRVTMSFNRRFPAALTRAFPFLAGTIARVSGTGAHRLVRAGDSRHFIVPSTATTTTAASILSTSSSLLFTQIREPTSFSVDIHHLFLRLGVERSHTLTRRCLHGFFEVGLQSTPSGLSTARDSVACIDGFSAVGGFELIVEVGERGRESVRKAVFLVKINGAVKSVVTDGVSVRDVFRENPRSGFVFLFDVVAAAVLRGVVAGCGGLAGR